MYDSNIGRWLMPDPYGQFASAYLGMGNDPVNSLDEDGGWSWVGFGTGAVVGGAIGYFASGKDWRGAVAGAAIGGLAGGILGDNGDPKKYGRKDASLWDRYRSIFGEGELVGKNTYMPPKPGVGNLQYSTYSGWVSKEIYFEVSSESLRRFIGVTARTIDFSRTFTFNPKYTKKLSFSLRSSPSPFIVTRNENEIFNNSSDRGKLFTPEFHNKGEVFRTIFRVTLLPMSGSVSSDGTNVPTQAVVRLITVHRRVHKVNSALLHLTGWERK